MVRYAHIGTGNYNEKTARTYEDVGMFTADPEIGADLSDLFNYLTGYSRQTTYKRLAVSPTGIRSRLTELIEDEASRSDGHITLKMNSLVDASNDRVSLRRFQGRHSYRSDRTRDLLSSPRSGRDVREHPGQVTGRQVSRALPDLSLRVQGTHPSSTTSAQPT